MPPAYGLPAAGQWRHEAGSGGLWAHLLILRYKLHAIVFLGILFLACGAEAEQDTDVERNTAAP